MRAGARRLRRPPAAPRPALRCPAPLAAAALAAALARAPARAQTRCGGAAAARAAAARLAAQRARARAAAGGADGRRPFAGLAQVPQLTRARAGPAGAAPRRARAGAAGAAAGAAGRGPAARSALPAAGAASFGNALHTSINAMGEVFTSLVIGALAYRRGILTPQALSSLSAVTVGMFIPALLCGKVARTAAEMQRWGVQSWLLLVPVCALAQIGLQLLVSGGVLRCLAGVDPGSAKGRIMRLATLFPNSAMPLLFCQAIFRGREETLLLAEGAIFFYLIGWSCTFWTAGFSLLQGAPAEGSPTSKLTLGASAEEAGPGADGAAAAGAATAGGARAALGAALGAAWAMLQRVLTPPVVGVFVGLVVGLVPFLRWLAVPHAHRAADPPLGFLFYGLEGLGRAAIPASQVVLSGSLARSLDAAWSPKQEDDEGSGEYRWRWRDVLSVCASRVLVSPTAAGLGLCWLLKSLGLLSLAPGVGRVLAFVLILESAMPSAQNAIVIPNLLGRPRMASAMAQLLLAVYVIALPCASLWLAVGLRWTGV